MYDLSNFGLDGAASCSKVLRDIGLNGESMEQVAGRIVRYLYDSLIVQPSGEKACALVRFFKTHAFASLNDDLKQFVRRSLGDTPVNPEMQCMVLLSTAGDEKEWNDCQFSLRHRAIPLPSVELVERMPMVSQLVYQMGFEISAIVQPAKELLIEPRDTSYGVFYVVNALESPHIPDQFDFVQRYSIKSVLGFGGMLPSGTMFAIIMFCRTQVPVETADLFRILALSTKVAVIPYDSIAVFSGAECRPT